MAAVLGERDVGCPISLGTKSRGYIKLLDGGHLFLENRICLDINHSFEANWVRRPDAMVVQSAGIPNERDWILTSKPYAILVSDNLSIANSGLYVSPEFPGWKQLKEKKDAADNASMVGRFLNLVQTFTDINMDSWRTYFSDHKNSGYLKMATPSIITRGTETMFLLSDIEFQTAVTEKDLDGAATVIVDGNLLYTQPFPKTGTPKL